MHLEAVGEAPAAQACALRCLFDVLKPVWPLLSINEQLALRSSCRAGRAAHDSLVELLSVHNLWGRTLPEDAGELYRGIRGMCDRGMRPLSLMLRFQGASLTTDARRSYGWVRGTCRQAAELPLQISECWPAR